MTRSEYYARKDAIRAEHRALKSFLRPGPLIELSYALTIRNLEIEWKTRDWVGK